MTKADNVSFDIESSDFMMISCSPEKIKILVNFTIPNYNYNYNYTRLCSEESGNPKSDVWMKHECELCEKSFPHILHLNFHKLCD